MKQNQNIKLIKKIFEETFPHIKFRFIKIHGHRYQESGLPDLMILSDGIIDPKQSIVFQRQMPNFWFEVKRNWKDKPDDLQKYNIKYFKCYNFVTGFISGDEFKSSWNDKPIKFKTYLENNI